MLSSVAAALIGYWFYNTASRSGRPALSWAISGVVVYFLAALLWTLTITPGLKDAANHNPSATIIFIASYAYIAVGLLAGVLLNAWLNKSVDTD